MQTLSREYCRRNIETEGTARSEPLIYGSGELIQTLMQHDLIDEYHFMVNPVIVGSGKHLFKTGNDTKALKLIETRTTSSGVVILSYQPEKKRIIIDKLKKKLIRINPAEFFLR